MFPNLQAPRGGFFAPQNITAIPNPFRGEGSAFSFSHFGDQLGDSFWPEKVSCLGSLPSASMVQICRVPVRVDSKTRCRPSGAQLGRSLRPASRVNSTSDRLTISII